MGSPFGSRSPRLRFAPRGALRGSCGIACLSCILWGSAACGPASSDESGGSEGAPRGFRPPSAAERRAAIGDTSSLPANLRRALEPGDDFAPIREPGPSDWLARHEEEGQTFEEFTATARNVPDRTRGILYLQPLGTFESGRSPPLDVLQEFAAAFFGMPVRSLEPIEIGKDDFQPRIHELTGKRQLLTGPIIARLKRLLPRDGFCILGVTMEDLYPDPTWNFVFGQASLRGRSGVYSFARYDRRFFGLEPEEDARKLLLRRSLKVLAHETAHMFGLLHCVYYDCLLNGSNHLGESDSHPLHLCPVCLRKLHASVGFDPSMRYETLHALYDRLGLEDDAARIARRQASLAGSP